MVDTFHPVTGFHDIDQYVQSQLLVAALEICIKTIAPGGTFVSKVFKGHDSTFLTSQFKAFFNQVDIVKPKSSRPSSVEHFIVCRFFNPPVGIGAGLKRLSAFSPFDKDCLKETNSSPEEEICNKKVYEYVTCGDLSAFDLPEGCDETEEAIDPDFDI